MNRNKIISILLAGVITTSVMGNSIASATTINDNLQAYATLSQEENNENSNSYTISRSEMHSIDASSRISTTSNTEGNPEYAVDGNENWC